ncbi:MAG: TIGR02594 family protein [Rhizobiales bacterium]|nr:TIGR02594 family protein [Hyphomicrobiales bacterium]
MQKYLQIAINEQGTKEIKGQKDNPKIVQYFADVGHEWVKDDETPWCAAFVGSCLEKAGLTSTRALNARSYLKWGRKIIKPVVGCVVIFKRGKSSWQGHVAFYMGETKTHIKVLGGNQGNTVKISRYKKSDLLGYRLSKTKLISKTNVASLVGVGGVVATQFGTIEKAIDKVTSITAKGGDIADNVGGVIGAFDWKMLAVIGVCCLFGYIIYERNKKVNEHGI